MIIKDWKKDLLTIPNFLSLFRMLLIPVYMYLYLHAETPKDHAIAATVLAISCLTDMIDGKIARKFNMISTVGKILDPLADKATQFVLMITLAMQYPVISYLCGLFVLKEGFQLIAGILLLRKGQILKGAVMSGKICTTVLFVSLIILVLFPEIPSFCVSILTVVDFLVMLVAFFAYMRAFSGKGGHIEDLPA